MTETLNLDLRALRCEGNLAFLPTEQLNNYPILKATLIKACGKYKNNSFEFPYPAQTVIDQLISGKSINFKKEFQFFATPETVAERLMDEIIFMYPEFDVLEPSAGHGSLIDALLKRNVGVIKHIDAIELSELNFAVLEEKYRGNENVNIIKGDFLENKSKKVYDLIIANPPFTNNQDIDHIRKMYSILGRGGQLISIASTSWLHGSQKKQIEFREWLDEIEAEIKPIKQGEFKSSGTNVESVLLVINKVLPLTPKQEEPEKYQLNLF